MELAQRTLLAVLVAAAVSGPAHAKEVANRFKDSGMNKYLRKNYTGAVADFDKYLAEHPDDQTVILLRGLSKSLLKPEDVAGACADFLAVKAGLKDMSVETYCANQPGW